MQLGETFSSPDQQCGCFSALSEIFEKQCGRSVVSAVMVSLLENAHQNGADGRRMETVNAGRHCGVPMPLSSDFTIMPFSSGVITNALS
jgi:hypothetical protein